MKKVHGLAAVEAVIVLGFLSAFLSVAIPVYNDFLISRHVVEAVSLSDLAKQAIIQFALERDRLPKNQAEVGYTAPRSSSNVMSIDIANDGSGIITLTTTRTAGSGTIEFVPTIRPGKLITWDCTAGTLEDKYRPLECN